MKAENKRDFDPRISRIFTAGLFICIAGVIYSNSFQGSFQLDDTTSITSNPAVYNLSNIRGIWLFWPCRFLTYLSFALNFHFSRFDVWGYHLVNLIIHIACAVLVWRLAALILRLFPPRGENMDSGRLRFSAVSAGLVFLTHPVQTEAVTYIVQRAASMACMFYLATLYLYIKSAEYRDRCGGPSGKKKKNMQKKNIFLSRLFYAGAVLSAVSAMFTKEITVTLPFAILLYHRYFLVDPAPSPRRGICRYALPFFMIVLIIPLTMLLTKSINFTYMRRAAEDPVNIPPLYYLFTQFRVILTYIRLIFLPAGQNLDYDYKIQHSFFELPAAAGFIAIILIIGGSLFLFRKKKVILFGILLFFLALLPESSIIPINDIIFEHRLYLPMGGFCIALAGSLSYVSGQKSRRIYGIVLAALILSYCFLTYKRNSVWKTEISLWSDVIAKSPHKARGYTNRGMAYQAKGDIARAEQDYKKALKLDPMHAGTWSNMGIIYEAQNDIDSAIRCFSKAIELRPDLAGVWYNRGYAYELKGRIKKALENYNEAISLKPDYADAYNNKGNIYLNLGRIDAAVSNYKKALEINPAYSPALHNLELIGRKMSSARSIKHQTPNPEWD